MPAPPSHVIDRRRKGLEVRGSFLFVLSQRLSYKCVPYGRFTKPRSVPEERINDHGSNCVKAFLLVHFWTRKFSARCTLIREVLTQYTNTKTASDFHTLPTPIRSHGREGLAPIEEVVTALTDSYSLVSWCKCEDQVVEEGVEVCGRTWWPLNPLVGTLVVAEDSYVVLDREGAKVNILT